MSDSFDNWLNELEQTPVAPACSIDNPECENCGS
jgi:hypothetical protein